MGLIDLNACSRLKRSTWYQHLIQFGTVLIDSTKTQQTCYFLAASGNREAAIDKVVKG